MGILGEIYEGRHVIAISGHKNENTIKQYVRKISAKKKREMCGTLADTILPKKPKESPNKFTFKSKKPAETISKSPEKNPLQEVDNNLQVAVPANNMEFNLEALDDAPNGDVLVQFLTKFEALEGQNVMPEQAVQVPQPPVAQAMNIQNIQNVNPNNQMPTLYFPNSTVTINYNFNTK